MRKNAPFSILSFKTFSALPTVVYMSVLYVMTRHIVICDTAHIIYSSLSIYSRSYWPDCHTVRQDECLYYWICL